MGTAAKNVAIGSGEWQELIVHGAGQLGVVVTADHLRQFALHADELLRWNTRVNLTRIVSPRDMALKHFVDSLAAAPLIETGKNVLDIGSGAGFPGIVLKIVRPEMALTLIDAVGKKVNFQRHVIRMLNLCGIQALHCRAEDLAKQKPAGFDVAVCRALADPAHLWRLSSPLLKPGGLAIAYQGVVTKVELATLWPEGGQAPAQVDIKSYRLPLDGSRRTIVLLTK